MLNVKDRERVVVVVGDFSLGINWCASSQMSVFTDGALDGFLRRSLGSGSMRTE